MKPLMIIKALADASRLEIFKLLIDREAYIEVISERLKLAPSTVSFHLKKLCDAGLVTSRKEQYYTMYSAISSVAELRIKDIIFGIESTLPDQDKVELIYKERVLKSFFKYGRLTKIPVQKKKRQWVLEKIASNFLPKKNYSITTATELLSEIYDDTGLLLKELQHCGHLEISNSVIRRK